MAYIVLNTFGSLGDLHPFLAIAIELRARGHEPVIATAEVYRTKIESTGIRFAPVRPDIGRMAEDTELIAKVWDPRRGTEYLLKDVILPATEEAFEDLEKASRGADMLITHTAGFAGPIVAEKSKLKWLSIVLQPMAFLSAYDPPIVAPAQWLRHTYRLGKWPFRLARQLAKSRVWQWAEPILSLRKRLGLPTAANPLFEGQFSPFGTLALFSSRFAQRQPDWPHNSRVTGFVYYDQLGSGMRRAGQSLTDERATSRLDEFLGRGSAPVVFTLGSSAVMHPGTFYEESLRAVRELGVRAIMLVGPQLVDQLSSNVDSSVFLADYAPYSQLMPRAAAIVHQGGIGTTAQAFRAGRPMLVVPWAHDQPDNGNRVQKLGAGLVLARSKYTATSAAQQLQNLLTKPTYSEAATRICAEIALEDGTKSACDSIEAALPSRS